MYVTPVCVVCPQMEILLLSASEGKNFGKCLLSLISLNVCVSVSEEKCTTMISNSNCKPKIKNKHLVTF